MILRNSCKYTSNNCNLFVRLKHVNKAAFTSKNVRTGSGVAEKYNFKQWMYSSDNLCDPFKFKSIARIATATKKSLLLLLWERKKSFFARFIASSAVKSLPIELSSKVIADLEKEEKKQVRWVNKTDYKKK